MRTLLFVLHLEGIRLLGVTNRKGVFFMPSDAITPTQHTRSLYNTKSLVTMAMLTALAYAVMAVCKVIPPIGGFLSLDLKDTVIAIGGFLYGPLAALLMSVAVSFLEFLTVSDTGWIGLLMNIIATAGFVCPAVYLYRRKHKTSAAVVGLITGIVCLTVLMVLWNYIMTPIFWGMPREAVVDMLVPLIIPFNLVKGGMNMAATLLLYKPVVTALRRANLIPASEHSQPRRSSAGYLLFSLALMATFVLLALVLMDVI